MHETFKINFLKVTELQAVQTQKQNNLLSITYGFINVVLLIPNLMLNKLNHQAWLCTRFYVPKIFWPFKTI